MVLNRPKTAALTIALPFLPWIGRQLQFVPPSIVFRRFLAAIVAAFLVVIELVKRVFYLRLSGASSERPARKASRQGGAKPSIQNSK